MHASSADLGVAQLHEAMLQGGHAGRWLHLQQVASAGLEDTLPPVILQAVRQQIPRPGSGCHHNTFPGLDPVISTQQCCMLHGTVDKIC